jgi:hypothetical protein
MFSPPSPAIFETSLFKGDGHNMRRIEPEDLVTALHEACEFTTKWLSREVGTDVCPEIKKQFFALLQDSFDTLGIVFFRRLDAGSMEGMEKALTLDMLEQLANDPERDGSD